MAQKKFSPVAQAYERSRPARDWLHQRARCMEATEDKCGIVWERWILTTHDAKGNPTFTNLVFYATPHGWDVFKPIADGVMIEDTMAALSALSSTGR